MSSNNSDKIQKLLKYRASVTDRIDALNAELKDLRNEVKRIDDSLARKMGDGQEMYGGCAYRFKVSSVSAGLNKEIIYNALTQELGDAGQAEELTKAIYNNRPKVDKTVLDKKVIKD